MFFVIVAILALALIFIFRGAGVLLVLGLPTLFVVMAKCDATLKDIAWIMAFAVICWSIWVFRWRLRRWP